jgi:hypothetical protein
LSKTNCNHNFCICCIVRVKKCPLCRTEFIFPKLFKDLEIFFIKKEKKKLSNIKNLFDILPNYIDQEQPNHIQNHNNLQQSNLYMDYVYLDSQERRLLAQSSHEYLIDQLDLTMETIDYVPLEQTNLNLI